MSHFIVKIFLSVLFLSTTYSLRRHASQCQPKEKCSAWEGLIDEKFTTMDFQEFSFGFNMKTEEWELKHALWSRDGLTPLLEIRNILGKVQSFDGVSGYIGPVFLRTAGKGQEWRNHKNFPGHFMLSENGKDIEYFRFFMPQRIPPSTGNQFYLDLTMEGACRNKDSGEYCASPDSHVSRVTKNFPVILTFAKAFNGPSNVVLDVVNNPTLSFQLNWITKEEKKLRNKIVERASEPSCKPELRVVMYEAAPRRDKNHINDEFRPILAKVTKKLELKSGSVTEVESEFKFDVPADIKDKLHFLSRQSELFEQGFYKGWTRENGIKIAVKICTCEGKKSKKQFARDDGCVEYQHEKVEIQGDIETKSEAEIAYWGF